MSHDPLDCFEHGALSSCCGARVMLGMICASCKEHCDADEPKEHEFSPEQQATIDRMTPQPPPGYSAEELERDNPFNAWM